MEIGDVEIQFLGHSGFIMGRKGGRKIAIDPYNVSSNAGKVDIILISHSHYDHCSIKDIEKLSRQGTKIIMHPDAQSKVTKLDGIEMQIIEIGDELDMGNIKIVALPAYNVEKEFHPKSEGWLGFLIKIGNVVIYHAGDCDKIPEMNSLTGYAKKDNQFVVLLPVSGTYVMNAEEAAEVASMLSPSLAIPMHYGSGVAGSQKDAEEFVRLCRERGLRAEILEKV